MDSRPNDPTRLNWRRHVLKAHTAALNVTNYCGNFHTVTAAEWGEERARVLTLLFYATDTVTSLKENSTVATKKSPVQAKDEPATHPRKHFSSY